MSHEPSPEHVAKRLNEDALGCGMDLDRVFSQLARLHEAQGRYLEAAIQINEKTKAYHRAANRRLYGLEAQVSA